MGATDTLTLSDGREITVDVSSLKVKEWRGFWDTKIPDKKSDEVVARLTGLNPEDLLDMLRDDYRRIIEKIIKLANRPLDDPNSQSASTSD